MEIANTKSFISRELKWSWEAMKNSAFACSAREFLNFHPGLSILLTMITREFPLFILKGANPFKHLLFA